MCWATEIAQSIIYHPGAEPQRDLSYKEIAIAQSTTQVLSYKEIAHSIIYHTGAKLQRDCP